MKIDNKEKRKYNVNGIDFLIIKQRNEKKQNVNQSQKNRLRQKEENDSAK